MPLIEKDLLHPTTESEAIKHKKKRLIQSPNSYFMDVKCPGCFNITTVFSHAQTVVLCGSCSSVLCQPTGGRCRLTEGCSFRRKQEFVTPSEAVRSAPAGTVGVRLAVEVESLTVAPLCDLSIE